jgi:hypothetical protein
VVEEHVTTVRFSGLEAPTKADLDEEIEAERSSFELRAHSIRYLMKRPPSAKAIERYLEELRAWMVGTTKVAIKQAHTFDL